MADSLATPSGANSTRKGRLFDLDSRKGRGTRTPWLSRRHTPYAKTPKTGQTFRSQAKDAKLKCGIDRYPASPKGSKKQTHSNSGTKLPNLCKNTFEDVIGKTLRVYHASPLYKFDTSNLKTFAEQLSGCLHLKTQKMVCGATGEINDSKYKADISVYKDISADDTKFSAVKVLILENLTSSSSPILTSIFCSVGRDDSEDHKLQNHFLSLPICVMNGPVEITRNVISWFEENFDCRITPMKFSSSDLGWYFSFWAGLSSSKKSVPIELCYGVSNVNGLSRILFSIEQKDAQLLWESIHNSNSCIFTEEESETFLKALRSHFYHHFKINLEGLSVTRVMTSIAYLATEGKLKIVDPAYAHHIFEQLTKAAVTKEFYGRL
ncbi:centromere protein L-like [Montipora capricornis]|uniref:centromere protein L-like n=1 Tax=Montipora capricornis TaxID=246305 RepID=UPI0035F19B48